MRIFKDVQIKCEYCDTTVTASNLKDLDELHEQLRLRGWSLHDAGWDGNYWLCPDCAEGIN